MARNIVHYGCSGSVRWSIDKDGTMLFRPVDGDEGTLDDSQYRKRLCGYIREWEKYRDLIKKVEAIGKIYLPENSNRMFASCHNLATIDLSHFDTSEVVDMDWMFADCYSLTSLDLSSFDMSNVKFMRGIVFDCRSLTNLDISGIKSMAGKEDGRLFEGCDSLSNLVLSENVEKTTNEFILLATLFKYNAHDWTFEYKLNYKIFLTKILLGHLEKLLNVDLSKERLKTITKEGINEITIWKSEVCPIKKVRDILKILRAYKIRDEKLENSNFQMLVKEGVVSDINTYLNGVPLADILA